MKKSALKKFFLYLHCLPFKTGYLLPLIFLLVIGSLYQSKNNTLFKAFSFSKPKQIIPSQTILPKDVAQAIQNLASLEIREEQAHANLALSNPETFQTGIVENTLLNIKENLTSSPSDKARIKIKIIDNLIAKLESQTSDQLVESIKDIGNKTDEIVRDSKVSADRAVLQLLIEQYNRLQLILQHIEDNLALEDYLKVEDARQKYLVVTATESINNAPNLDAVHNVALKEVKKVVGDDFAELKAVEIISDFEAGIKPEGKEKLNGLQKQLAVEFQKKMLKIPKDLRDKKLSEYIKYSFGNPIKQVQAFDKMKGFLTSRELILGVDNLRKLALQRVKVRISEADSEEKIKSFLGEAKALEGEAKKLPENKLTKEEQQALYEKIQQIVQNIFLSSDGQKNDLETKLPDQIQSEVDKLKQELPDRNVPKIETPQGVNLPKVAKLPDEVGNAIVVAAKKKIEKQNKSKEVELDLSLQAKDLGLSNPVILPGNPLYLVKEIIRKVDLIITLDPVAKASELVKQDNEKTLEAAKLVSQNEDTKTINLALDTLKGVQKDFDKLKQNANKVQGKNVDSLIDQIIENGVARQTVLSAIEDKVYGDTYVEIEKIRSKILKDGVDTLLKLTNNDVSKLTNKLEEVIQKSSGSDLKEIKAIELLTEIAKTQPKNVGKILDGSIDKLAGKLEKKLLSMPKEERVQKVLDYVNFSPGNPVIQFEAADELKSHFGSPDLIKLTEGIKDKAVENLTDLVSEITDGSSKQEFVDIVVGNKVEDLKIITDIEIRVEPPTGIITPIAEEVKEIKAEVEQNIVETYANNPTQLVSDLTPEKNHVTDILDVKTVQEIADILASSPEVASEVVKDAQKLESEVINNFIEDVSKEANKALIPVPEVIAELVELKDQTPASVDVKIDVAIKAEVKLIEEHLISEVNDPTTFENYITQITQDPVISKTVTQVGGSEFTKALEQTTQEIHATATKEQTVLVETVKQVENEIFSNATSKVEQTLPQSVQEQIQEIKKEVPAEQVPAVTTPSVSISTPAPVQSQPVPQTTSAAPTQTESAPAVVAPPAPAPAPVVPEVVPVSPAVGL